MNGRSGNENSNLNDLEKHLYGQKKGLPFRPPTVLRQKSYGVRQTWQEKSGEKIKKARLPTSFFKKFFFVAVVFFIVMLGVSLFIFFSGGSVVSPENIDIVVSGTSFAVGGEKLPLLIEIKNNNRSDLELADLVIEYPKGGFGTELARIREALGTVSANATVAKVIEPVLLGEEGQTLELRIALEYRLKNSNAIFVKETKHPVALSSSPILVSFEGPTSVTADQEFVFDVKVSSNATTLLQNLGLTLRYPSGFIFSESRPKAAFANNFFELGDLATGGSKSIQIRGRLAASENESRTFAAEVGEMDKLVSGKLTTVFAAKLQTVLLTSPFVEARILVGDVYAPEYTAASQTIIPIAISWANNRTVTVNNLEIKVKLSGLFDESSIDVTDGFYDSLNDTVVFSQNTNSDFAAVAPSARGIVSFSLNSSPLFAGGALVEKPQIVIEVSIKGAEPTLGTTAEVTNFERRVIKLGTELSILAKALHFSGPIKNTGLVPPKVDTETTYTIVWTITNSSSAVTRARVAAVLPPYVSFVGNFSPASENITYSEGSREVVWRPSQINPGIGLVSSSKEAAFQVTLRPSASQVGTSPDIIGETTLVGEDSFTKITLTARRRSQNTLLTDDLGFPAAGGVVIQ